MISFLVLSDETNADAFFLFSLAHIQLLVFLANDLSIEDVFAKVKLFFQLKMNSPEVFRNRSPYSNEISRTFENQNFLYLPVTPDGYSVVYSSLKNYSVSTFDLNSLAKAFFMTAGEF